jgi:hypothetical protein
MAPDTRAEIAAQLLDLTVPWTESASTNVRVSGETTFTRASAAAAKEEIAKTQVVNNCLHIVDKFLDSVGLFMEFTS